MIGSTIDGYKILRQIGRGGMATVYYAEKGSEAPVAIKVLNDEFSSRAEIRKRFEKEASIMDSMNLREVSGIAKIFKLLTTENGKLAIIMEYLEGYDLENFVREKGFITDYDFLKSIGKQALETLQSAHNAGIIHRDIKPSNLFLTNTGQIKILDFGISKTFFESNSFETELKTSTHQQIGTTRYMSPEQIRCSADVDNRTDIYSLGSTLYYLTTGNDPLEMEEESYSTIKDICILQAIKHATKRNIISRTPNCSVFLQELFQTTNEIDISGSGTKNSKLKISTDLDCNIYIDGKHYKLLNKGDFVTIFLNKGTYFLRFVSAACKVDIIEHQFVVDKVSFEYLLQIALFPIEQKRIREEEKQRKKKEEEKQRLIEEEQKQKEEEANKIRNKYKKEINIIEKEIVSIKNDRDRTCGPSWYCECYRNYIKNEEEKLSLWNKGGNRLRILKNEYCWWGNMKDSIIEQFWKGWDKYPTSFKDYFKNFVFIIAFPIRCIVYMPVWLFWFLFFGSLCIIFYPFYLIIKAPCYKKKHLTIKKRYQISLEEHEMEVGNFDKEITSRKLRINELECECKKACKQFE